jgi:hypothetical protein
MILPGTQTIIAIILIIIGSIVITHSATVVAVKKKDGKTYTSKHWGYMAIGVALILIGCFLMYRVINYYRTNYKSDVKNAVWVQMPEKFGKWMIDNTNKDLKFPKYIGNFVDANVNNVKGVKKDSYNRYGSESGAEVASVAT